MCTSLSLPTPRGTTLFGRTLDLDAHFGEAVTLTPRRYPLAFADCYPHTHHYALLGMATVMDGYPLYAEAMNEKGLCMAGLRFAGNAVYAPRPENGWLNLAPWELIPYLLGTCATVEEARAALRDIHLVDKPFSVSVGTAPLHWHIWDADPAHGGLVVEATAAGMRVYDNETGVLTNDPPFPEQMTALRVCHPPRGDAAGLPGDYSSPSRFVRAATLRRWVTEWMSSPQAERDDTAPAGEVSPVTHFFRILAAVAPMAGVVLTEDGKPHRTLYTCCMDTAAGVYHYFTEADTVARSVSFSEQDRSGGALTLLSEPIIPKTDRISHPY